MTSRQSVDPYRELGVDREADERVIRAAYHRKARATHPDLGGDDQAMARVNSAYDVLKHPAGERSSTAAISAGRGHARSEDAALDGRRRPSARSALGRQARLRDLRRLDARRGRPSRSGLPGLARGAEGRAAAP